MAMMPPDTREKEKIIGGIMDITQFSFVCAGLVICASITVALFKFVSWLGFFLGFPFIVLGLVFAFKRVEEMTLYSYLKYKRRFKKKTKEYINVGYHKDLEFDVEK